MCVHVYVCVRFFVVFHACVYSDIYVWYIYLYFDIKQHNHYSCEGLWRKSNCCYSYESKGKQWAKSRSEYPVGLNPTDVAAAKARVQERENCIPGLAPQAKQGKCKGEGSCEGEVKWTELSGMEWNGMKQNKKKKRNKK